MRRAIAEARGDAPSFEERRSDALLSKASSDESLPVRLDDLPPPPPPDSTPPPLAPAAAAGGEGDDALDEAELCDATLRLLAADHMASAAVSLNF